MNTAFQKYLGVRINGKWYSKDTLANLVPIETTNVDQALAFAKILFGSNDSLTVHTSGSTGKPKGISFPKSAFIQSAEATNAFFNLDENSEALLTLPLRYIAGKMMVVRAIVGQFNLIVLEPSGHAISKDTQTDFVPLTPSQLAAQIDIVDPKQVKIVLLGGGAVSEDLKSKIFERGISAFASFGMTETLSHFALAKITHGQETVFEVLPGVQIKMDADCKLLVNWPGITQGWLQTNDLVEIDGNGFTWLGRADNLINSGGVKIIPERVEEKLRTEIPNDFFVYGLSDANYGEVVVLFIEGAPFEFSLDEITWDNPYQNPKQIIWLTEFQRTTSGKTQRKATVADWLKTKSF